VTPFDWYQLSIDTVIILSIAFHPHSITWRRRR
jgi:hypothetical protein